MGRFAFRKDADWTFSAFLRTALCEVPFRVIQDRASGSVVSLSLCTTPFVTRLFHVRSRPVLAPFLFAKDGWFAFGQSMNPALFLCRFFHRARSRTAQCWRQLRLLVYAGPIELGLC